MRFFDHTDQFEQELAEKEALIFLDYDGTLTPIVNTPDLAVISKAMRQTVRALAGYYKVSVVSGRATDDVKEKVNIDGIFYAGSHGFEILDPQGSVKINDDARATRGIIDKVHADLEKRLQGVDGALVEHVKYTVSVHYRLVSDKDFPKVKEAVDEALKEHKELCVTHGKKVFELRPALNWHKGRAVAWILRVLNFTTEKNTAIYIGDDTTDEDAFEELEDKGFSILVAEEPRPSKAKYVVSNPDEVKKVLEFLIRIKKKKPGS